MQRAGKILVVCHCLLNVNAKVRPLASCEGVHMNHVAGFIEAGFGLVQLPCPETAVLGMARWGMTREQYDTPFYRRACRALLEPVMDQLTAFDRAGYRVHGVVGMDGSPNCGVYTTCTGFRGGEVSAPESDVPGQIAGLKMVSGPGVLMEEFMRLLRRHHLEPEFYAVDESVPGNPLVHGKSAMPEKEE